MYSFDPLPSLPVSVTKVSIPSYLLSLPSLLVSVTKASIPAYLLSVCSWHSHLCGRRDLCLTSILSLCLLF